MTESRVPISKASQMSAVTTFLGFFSFSLYFQKADLVEEHSQLETVTIQKR